MKTLWRRLRRHVSFIENVVTHELPPLPENPGYIPGRDLESFKAYKQVQKEVQNAVKKARHNSEQKLAKGKKANSKAFFSHIKKTTSNTVSVGPLKEGDKIVSDSRKWLHF